MHTDRIRDILNGTIDRMEAHRGLNVALLLAYVAFILFGHAPFVRVSISVMTALTLPVYNLVVAALTASFGIAFVALMLFFLRKYGPDRSRQIFYLVSIVLLLVLHHMLLFEMNIEVIHAALYAGLALVLFPFTRSPGATIVLAMPVMMVDEWYQYIVLYPEHVLYFDFNDILMDMLGSATMLCGIWVMGVRLNSPDRPFLLRKEAIMLAFLVGCYLLAVCTCLVAQFPDNGCDHTWLVLNRLYDPLQFWRAHPFTGRVYHAMPPAAGMVVITLAAIFFMGMRNVPPQRAAGV